MFNAIETKLKLLQEHVQSDTQRYLKTLLRSDGWYIEYWDYNAEGTKRCIEIQTDDLDDGLRRLMTQLMQPDA